MRSFLLACCALLCATASLFAQAPSVSLSFADAQRRHRVDVPTGQVRMEMCGLTLGHTYRVLANPAFERQADKPSLTLERGAAPASAQRPHQLSFTAYAPCMELWLDVPAGPEGATVPLSISASCADCPDDRQASQEWLQKFKEKVGVPDMAPLQVSAGSSATDLVRNVLIGGDCFDVTNITTAGNSNSRGTFSNGNSSISIANGVVLSSGHVNELPGPNVFSDADGGFAVNSPNDPDLNKLSTGDQFDLSKLEFDFVPTANTLRFEFVFGSEEYCEFVGSQYNDVFGFFISGPGIAGTLNIGLIPGTSTPVTINNVNHNKNSTYYINNRLDPLNCLGWQPTAFNDIELDGYTKVFTATANVQPCQKYHIKLAIADIQDERYCSAVFLKANSFNAGGQIEVEPVYANSQPNALENCGQSFLRFKRSAGDVNVALPVSYSISPQSTAQVGLDYTALPTSVVIPAGQTEILVPVSLFQDGITEGQEKIVIALNNSCTCTEQKVDFLINDRPLLDATLTDEAVCGGTPALLQPTVGGGLAPITYLWSTGQTSNSISVVPPALTIYTVTVSDACGSSQVLSSQVSVQPLPSGSMSGSGILCTPSSTATLTLTLSGQSPWEVEWKNPGSQTRKDTLYASPATIPVNSAGTYTLISVSTQGGCVGTASGTATISSSNLNLSLSPTNPPCHGAATGSISALPNGGSLPYTYLWNTSAKTASISSLAPGTYTVTVTENAGCTSTATVLLTEPSAILLLPAVKNHINCYTPTGNADVAANGGTPAAGGIYQVKWSNGATTSAATFSTGGTYTVTVTDQNNCSSTAAVSINADLTPPIAVAKSLHTLDCNTEVADLSAEGTSTGANIQFKWSGGTFICCENSLNPQVDAPGMYTLSVTNTTNGCTATATTSVTENTDMPTALALKSEPPGCKVSTGNVQILGVTGGSSPYLYQLDGSGTYSEVAIFKSLQPGAHILSVQDANGCEFADTIVFQEVIRPDIDLLPVLGIGFGQTTELKALLNIPLTLVDTILWSPTESITPDHDPLTVQVQPFKTTTYTAIVIGKNGCEDRATVQVKVDEPHIWAPNAIRPDNSASNNDVFRLYASEGSVQQVVRLQIFDRWGTLMFLKQGGNIDDRSGWDGTYKGKIVGSGVYAWAAEVALANGESLLLKGDVTVIR